MYIFSLSLLDSDKGKHNPNFQNDEHVSTIGTPIKNPERHIGSPTKAHKNKHTVTLLHVYNLDMKFPLENGTAENGNALHVIHDEIDNTSDPVSEHHVDVSDVTSADGSVVRYVERILKGILNRKIKNKKTSKKHLPGSINF